MVREKLLRVQERISLAAARSGRRPEDVTLVAVSKGQPAAKIREAIAAGQLHFGENYLQEAVSKRQEIGEAPGVVWHAIGHLQSNKIKMLGQFADWFHALDSVRLLHKLVPQALELARLRFLVEIDLDPSGDKTGLDESELRSLLEAVEASPFQVVGLMTMATLGGGDAVNRPIFRHLKEIGDRINSQGWRKTKIQFLSMGMSDDFETAIEEGATHVRVGRAIFGDRL